MMNVVLALLALLPSPSRLLVKFAPSTHEERVQVIAAANVVNRGRLAKIHVHVLDNVTPAAKLLLKQNPRVEWVEEEQLFAPQQVTANDPYFMNWEWNLKKMQCPLAWSVAKCQGNPIVAVLDTGVDSLHADLQGNAVAGWNAYDQNDDSRDVNGHGTLVAGIVGAVTNNGLGVASVGWNPQLMPIRVSDINGFAGSTAIARGVVWAADHGAKVANISYVVSNSLMVSEAARYMKAAGGLVVTAAGNGGVFDSAPENPDLITVSMTDGLDVLVASSNRGNNIDVSAPDSGYTTVRGGGYTIAGGTSIAAPNVAGVVALIFAANSALTPAQVEDVLKRSADDLGVLGWDALYGWGRVNAYRAVLLATGQNPDITPPTCSITVPSNGSVVASPVTVVVEATDNIALDKVELFNGATLVGTLQVEPFVFVINAPTPGASYTLLAKATDTGGNTATSTITFSTPPLPPDLVPPTVAITMPIDGALLSTPNQRIQVNTSDNVGVTRVDFYANAVLIGSSISAPFSLTWRTRTLAPGNYTLYAKAFDQAGNSTVSSTISVRR